MILCYFLGWYLNLGWFFCIWFSQVQFCLFSFQAGYIFSDFHSFSYVIFCGFFSLGSGRVELVYYILSFKFRYGNLDMICLSFISFILGVHSSTIHYGLPSVVFFFWLSLTQFISKHEGWGLHILHLFIVWYRVLVYTLS